MARNVLQEPSRDEYLNVAAGLAVLAGIAASDAICGIRLGRIHRGDDHTGAQDLLRQATHDGRKLAAQLGRLLSLKDAAHYGVQVVSSRNATTPPDGRPAWSSARVKKQNATMRLAGREALYRSAVSVSRGTVPTMRELLLGLKIPRTYMLPEEDGPLPGARALIEAGVAVVPVPDCGHNIMLDNPDAFARATAAALDDRRRE